MKNEAEARKKIPLSGELAASSLEREKILVPKIQLQIAEPSHVAASKAELRTIFFSFTDEWSVRHSSREIIF
jgi:hypothetical protein